MVPGWYQTVMPQLPAETLYDFIVKDFERAWDAMALADFEQGVGGNFMFARQAMVLLELASRVAEGDQGVFADFSVAVNDIDPGYFTALPADGTAPSWLPYLPSNGERSKQLLSVLFDLVRNGQMHYGQQIPVTLGDGAYLAVSLGGVIPNRTLEVVRKALSQGRLIDHLAFRKRASGHFELWVQPEVLFLDFRAAIERAHVFERGTFDGFKRRWKATGSDLEDAIRHGKNFLMGQSGEILHPETGSLRVSLGLEPLTDAEAETIERNPSSE